MSSNNSLTTIVIAVVLSVALSTATIMTVPQVQDAIRGAQGVQGIQGIQGETGSPGISEVTQAELEELARASIADIEEVASSCEDKAELMKEQILALQEYDLWVDGMLISIIENLWVNEERLDSLELGSPELDSPELIYDSGWFGINEDTTKYLTTLPNQNVFVYMIGRTSGNTAHQYYYGGDSQLLGTVQIEKGAYWKINSDNQLRVYRYPLDAYYEYIRVVVWQLPS